MSAKPIIAINGDFRPERSESVALSWFNSGYYNSIVAAGGIPRRWTATRTLRNWSSRRMGW